MRVSDESRWVVQQAELRESETGGAFLAFMESWLGRAERVIDDKGWTPDEALRQTLGPTDAELGRLSSNFLGQMLVVIVSHWVHGEEVDRGLTPLEHRVFEDYVALLVATAQQVAEGAAGE